MTVTSYFFGYKIVWDGSEWRFADNGEPTETTWKTRKCGKCNESITADGHDPCIANLPGVLNACCGHGGEHDIYVMFEDRSVKRGEEAKEFFRKHQK
jgi:hypothetical protein